MVNADVVELNSVGSEGTSNGFVETAFWGVFFNNEELVVGGLSGFAEGLDIDWLDGEEIDDSDTDVLASEGLGSVQGFDDGDTGRGNGDDILVRLEEDLSLSDLELLVVGVEELRVGSGGSDVGASLVVGSQFNSSFTGNGIRWVEADGSDQRSELREIFQTHLGGTILTEGDTSVGTNELDVSEGDRSHSHLIEGSGEEGSETRDEGNLLSDDQTLGNTDEVLFSDVTFDELFWVGFFQVARVGGDLGVTIQSEEGVGLVVLGESLEGVTVTDSDSDFLVFIVVEGIRELKLSLTWFLGLEVRLSWGELNVGVDDQALEVVNGSLGEVGEDLTVPVEGVFDVVEEVSSLGSLGNDSDWLVTTLEGSSLGVGFDDFSGVVAIDEDGFPAEGLESLFVDAQVSLDGGGTRLTNTVDIDDGGKVAELVDVGEVSGFPDGTFNSFTITHQAVVSVGDLVNVLGGISHTASNRETLTQRAGGNIDEVELGGWVTFKGRVDLSQSQELFSLQEAVVGPAGVEKWGTVTFGDDESIIRELLGVSRVVVHAGFVEEEDGKEISTGGAGGWVTRFSSLTSVDDVESEEVGKIG